MSASIVAQLLFLEADNPEKLIHLYINSPGGSVTAGRLFYLHPHLFIYGKEPSLTVSGTHPGLAVYDTMSYIQSPVATICMGQAASMGSLLLAGGEPGKRSCLPHSSVMVHQPTGGYFGQASDIAIHAKEILRVRTQLNEIYRRHLTKPHTLEQIERLVERDHFMGAHEALELGIVDQIMTRRTVGVDGDGGGGAGGSSSHTSGSAASKEATDAVNGDSPATNNGNRRDETTGATQR